MTPHSRQLSNVELGASRTNNQMAHNCVSGDVIQLNGFVMEQVDMSVLETDAEKHAGPSPAKATIQEYGGIGIRNGLKIRWEQSRESSSLSTPTIYRDLAQLGEHLSYKQKVSSSTLLISTIYGAIGEVINTPDCDSGIHRFNSYIAPQEYALVV